MTRSYYKCLAQSKQAEAAIFRAGVCRITNHFRAGVCRITNHMLQASVNSQTHHDNIYGQLTPVVIVKALPITLRRLYSSFLTLLPM